MKQYLNNLKTFVSFKTISTDKRYKDEMKKAVSWLSSVFLQNGFRVSTFKHKNSNPIICAKFSHNKKTETVLIYGHYDVQPAHKKDWSLDPFEIKITKTKILGRGVVDNKGQILIHITTIFKLIKEKKLKYNIIFLIEGDEESGSEHLEDILKKNKKLLHCDHIIFSDGEMTNGFPTIDTSFRGGFNMSVTLTSAQNDLHSGIFGGAVPNAANEMTKLLAKIYDKNNTVTIPGFYKNVDKISKSQISTHKKLSDEKTLCELACVKKTLCESGLDFYTQTGMRPTIQITGLSSGYCKDGYANIVPSSACAKLNIRIVPSQNANEMAKAVQTFFEKNIPKYLKSEIKIDSKWPPIKLKHDQEIFEEIQKILEKIYKKPVITKYCGGSLPIIGSFKNILGHNPISVSLANEDCNMHGVNENFQIKYIKKGLEVSEKIFGK